MMRVLPVKLVTESEVLVGVPDNLEIVHQNGHAYIVEPVTEEMAAMCDKLGEDYPCVLLDPTVALRRGLLVKLQGVKAL